MDWNLELILKTLDNLPCCILLFVALVYTIGKPTGRGRE